MIEVIKYGPDIGVCPNTLNTILSIIDPKNHKRKKSQCDTC